MNNNIKKNKSRKNKVRKRNNYSVPSAILDKGENIYSIEKRLPDGGFIAWPETKTSKKEETHDIEIIEGRSKKGGFIAFPKI